MHDVEAENDIHAWERKAVAALLSLLTACFTIWASVVWSSGQKVVEEMRAARLEDAQYRLAMERRLTIIEQQQSIMSQRQAWVIDNMMELQLKKGPP